MNKENMGMLREKGNTYKDINHNVFVSIYLADVAEETDESEANVEEVNSLYFQIDDNIFIVPCCIHISVLTLL